MKIIMINNCNNCELHSDTKIYINEINLDKQGNNKEWLLKHGKYFLVDKCCREEILWLLNKGVQTINCCCGHNDNIPVCIIRNESVELAKSLGYQILDNIDFANKDTMSIIRLKFKK